nr:translation initiation factor IF-2-like isoform X2 [Manis javanica]
MRDSYREHESAPRPPTCPGWGSRPAAPLPARATTPARTPPRGPRATGASGRWRTPPEGPCPPARSPGTLGSQRRSWSPPGGSPPLFLPAEPGSGEGRGRGRLPKAKHAAHQAARRWFEGTSRPQVSAGLRPEAPRAGAPGSLGPDPEVGQSWRHCPEAAGGGPASTFLLEDPHLECHRNLWEDPADRVRSSQPHRPTSPPEQGWICYSLQVPGHSMKRINE